MSIKILDIRGRVLSERDHVQITNFFNQISDRAHGAKICIYEVSQEHKELSHLALDGRIFALRVSLSDRNSSDFLQATMKEVAEEAQKNQPPLVELVQVPGGFPVWYIAGDIKAFIDKVEKDNEQNPHEGFPVIYSVYPLRQGFEAYGIKSRAEVEKAAGLIEITAPEPARDLALPTAEAQPETARDCKRSKPIQAWLPGFGPPMK